MRSQHAAIAMITQNNLLVMKEMKKETILKLFVGTSSLKIVQTEAPMPRKNVSIKIEIWQVSQYVEGIPYLPLTKMAMIKRRQSHKFEFQVSI